MSIAIAILITFLSASTAHGQDCDPVKLQEIINKYFEEEVPGDEIRGVLYQHDGSDFFQLVIPDHMDYYNSKPIFKKYGISPKEAALGSVIDIMIEMYEKNLKSDCVWDTAIEISSSNFLLIGTTRYKEKHPNDFDDYFERYSRSYPKRYYWEDFKDWEKVDK